MARIVILGGGFGGLYTALELERVLARRSDLEVTLVNRDNFFLFTPMLHEVAASDLDVTHIVNPVRKLLKRVRFFEGNAEQIDVEKRTVLVNHTDGSHGHVLEYDQLVLGLGSVTNFFELPGLEERAFTMRTLGDALALRNRLIANLEAADFECASGVRDPLLTVVVAGGGFAGVETIAGINDFVREALRFYPHLSEELISMVLVHPGEYLLPELGEKLGRYARDVLASRGVEVRLKARVARATDRGVELSDGTFIDTNTLVWTAGNSVHPLIATLPAKKARGRLVVDEFLRVEESPGVWALGDCASTHPPTAQHALREGKLVARNLIAAVDGREMSPFVFRTIGQLAAIGRRTGVARILGVNFSGFLAWWLWRTIYLAKLPRFEKKVRVALDWALDLMFSKDLVQLQTPRTIRRQTRKDHESQESSGDRAPRGRLPAREELETIRTLPLREAVGDGP
ncbi:MAG TPA: NAD(P)/FAD-dependent oxidoreductase [Vicinamibacteria bacterium]|nr:NAD(P)/FAD-dependent oxidoreductase [Vicinamibacteria bacterium]